MYKILRQKKLMVLVTGILTWQEEIKVFFLCSWPNKGVSFYICAPNISKNVYNKTVLLKRAWKSAEEDSM